MRRNFNAFRGTVLDYRASGEGSDARIAAAIQARLDQADGAGDDDFIFDGLDTALTDAFMAAMSLFLSAVERGEPMLLGQALERLRTGLSICSELNMLPQWWAHRVAIHFIADLWSNTFHERVPRQPAGGEAADWPRLPRTVHCAVTTPTESARLISGHPRSRRPLGPSISPTTWWSRFPLAPARRASRNSASTLPRRPQAGRLRHASARAIGADGNHPAEDLRSPRQDGLCALRQHRRQRF